MDSREQEEHSLVKNKHRNLNGSQKKIVLGGPTENELRKAVRKVMKAFGRVVLALTKQQSVQGFFQPARRQKQGPKRKGQGRCLSSIWFFCL